MIMAKFEQLERIQKEAEEAKKERAEGKKAAAAAAAEAGEGGGDAEMEGDDVNDDDADNDDFDEEMLLKVFKQTSQFSVKSALADDMYGSQTLSSQDDDDEGYDDDQEGMQGVDGEFWNEIFGGSQKKKRKGAGGVREPRVPKEKKPRVGPLYKLNPVNP
jgi:hypothetical protein